MNQNFQKPCFGTFIDEFDQREYNTVSLGNQIWMAENFCRDTLGSLIYDENYAMFGKYGRLYNYDDARDMCPSGWKIPSIKDFETLFRYIGRNSISKDIVKELLGQSENGIDSFGFNVLLGGCCLEDYDTCVGQGTSAYFWVSDFDDDGIEQHLSICNNRITLSSFTDVTFCSVRYIKKQATA